MPAWIDAIVDSADKQQRLMSLYSSLFGWTWDEGSAATGHYCIARNNGRAVMGVGQGPGTEGKMVTYFATDDIESSCELARSLGANVFVGPIIAGDGSGQLALVLDPVGVVHGLWQAGSFAGFGSLYEEGAPGWFDHASNDPASAVSYYSALLDKLVLEPEPSMQILADGEQWFASVSTNQLPERGSMWNAIIVVDSLERLRNDVVALGGSVVVEEMPVPGSAISIFVEPVNHTYVTVAASGPGVLQS